MTLEVPAEKQAEFDKFKVEGFKNPDGSSFDPDTGEYSDGKGGGRSMTPEGAFKFKQPEAGAFKEVKKEEAKEGKKAEVEEKKADVKVEAAGAKIELKTTVGLDVLQNQMKDKFTDLTEAMKVELRDSPALKAAFPLDKNFDGAALVSSASGNVQTELLSLFSDTSKKGQFNKLVSYLKPYFQSEGKDISEEDVSKTLARLYSISAGESLKKQFDDMRLADFAKSDFAKTVPYAMNYDISFDKTNLVTKVTSDATFDQEFKEYNDKTPKVVDPKEKEKNDARLDRARKFRNTLPGRFLAMSGILTLEDPIEGEDAAGKAAREARNDQAYAGVLKGENFIAKWIIVLCGGSAMLEGGAADVEESIAGMDSKYKGIVAKFQAVAANSPLSLKKTAEQLAAPVEEILALDDVQFKKALAEKTLPATFKLKEAYKAGDKGTKIVLGEGAEMILKKGAKVRAGDKEVVAEEADKSFKGTVVVKYDIPAGTVFKGKVEFVPAEQEVVPAKPAPDAKGK